MLTRDTPDNLKTEDPQAEIPAWVLDSEIGPRKRRETPPATREDLERALLPGEVMICLGKGESDDGGHQMPLAVRRVHTAMRLLASTIEKSREIGPKSDCVCLYAGIPVVAREWESALKTNCGGVDILPADLDGCIKTEEDLERVKAHVKGLERILHTSGSHNPMGGHPTPEKRGQHRYRLILRWARRLTYSEHKRATLEFLAGVAGVLGHDSTEIPAHKLSSWLLERGVDPACSRAMQPAYLPRWPNQEVADQAEVTYQPGEGLDPTPLLEAHEARLERFKKTIPTRAGAPIVVQTPAPIPEVLEAVDVDTKIARARAYLSKLGPCQVGGGGHEKGFRGILACWGLDLELEDAWTVLQEWNQHHDPERRITRRRLEVAYAGGITTPRGAMLAPRVGALEAAVDLEALVDAETPPPSTGTNSAFCERARLGSIEKERTHTRPSAPGGEAAARYLPPHTRAALEAARVHLIRAPTGAGKTTALAPAVADLLEDGERVVACSHRVTLCQDIGHGLGLPSYQDSQGALTSSAVVCLPSISRVDPWGSETCEEGPTPMVETRAPIGLFVGDEIEQIIRSLFSSICKDNRAGTYSSLKSRMLCAGTVVLQDADLGPLTLALLKEVFGTSLKRDDIRVIDHKAKPGIKVVITESRPHHLMRITRGLEGRTRGCGPGLWEFSTSQEEVIARAKWAKETYPELKILDLHSDTIEDYRHILEDKEALAKFDYVICSPTLGSGYNFDSQKLATDAEFAVFGTCRSFCGSLAQDCKQGLSRVRHPHGGVWHVLVEGASQDQDTHHRSAEDFYRDLLKVSAESERLFAEIGSGWRETLDISGVPVRHPVDDELCRLWSHVQAHKDRWSRLKGPAGALREHLESCRYDVEYRTKEDEDAGDTDAGRVIAEANREAKKKAREIEEGEVLRAPEIDEEEAAKLNRKQLRRTEERALRRHRIQSYTGLPYDEITLEHIRWWGGKRGTGAKCGTAFADLVNILEGWGQAVLYSDFKALNGGSRVDLKNRFIKAKLLSKIFSLFGLGDLREDARKGTIITPPKALSKRLRETIATVWGYRGAMKKTPMEVLSHLLRSIGVKLRRKTTRTGDGFSSAYWIDADSVSWSVEVTRHHIEQSRRDRRELEDRTEVEDLFPGSPEIDLEEIHALMMEELAA